jgi:hypothetical protein
MLLIQSEAHLLAAFRPRDRESVVLAPPMRYPLLVREHRAWVDPQGFRTFLILAEPGGRRPLGIVFQRDAGGGVPVSQMCDWCHATGSSNEIGLLTTAASSRRRVGVNVCLDLRCAEKLEDEASRSGRNHRELVGRLNERMLRFAREGLGIDFASAEGARP